jgi:hypothetical protein
MSSRRAAVRAELVGRERRGLDQPVTGGTIDATMAKNVRADNTECTSGEHGWDRHIVASEAAPARRAS